MCGIYIYGMMFGGPLHVLRLYDWTAVQTSQSSDTVPPHSCHFLGQSHTQRLLSSLSVEDVCVYVCARSASIAGAKGSGSGGRRISTSPLSFTARRFLLVTFFNRSVCFSKHGCRGLEESGSVARPQRGQEWEDRGRKGTDRVGVRIPLSDPANAF